MGLLQTISIAKALRADVLAGDLQLELNDQ